MKYERESDDGNSVAEPVARSFLLGDLDTPERERIERLFVTVPEIRETILLVEDDLLQDYLGGNLTSAEAEKFRASYARNPGERRRLRIAQALREHAIANSSSSSTHPSVFERLRLALTRWPANQRIAVPLFATLVIVVTVAAIWIGMRMSRTAREQNQQAAVERQLAELNSPSSMRAKPPRMLSTTIAPVSVRSLRSSPEFSLSPDLPIIELSLIWPQKEDYSSYQAELSRVGGGRVFMLPPLQLEKDGSGRVVHLRLPAALLPGGMYRITLNGLRSDGVGPSEEYDFLVTRK